MDIETDIRDLAEKAGLETRRDGDAIHITRDDEEIARVYADSYDSRHYCLCTANEAQIGLHYDECLRQCSRVFGIE